ncbi:MAG: response regulator [Deltaproteobacteria bacterium]|nr:response regulator [Deltaproteobacteria bacterium]
MKILLAEDDTGLRDTLSEGLRGEGYTVVAVANGQAALQALEAENDFAAAILDGLLPKMTGFDVAVKVRGRANLGVVLMSGVFKGAQQQQEHLQKSGARAYLTKPFDLRRLVDTLRPFAPPPASSTAATQAQQAPAVPQQPLPAEGNLVEAPVLYLGWRIHREQHTGVLEVWGPEKARLFVYKGRLVFAQHSDPMLHIGIELMKDGTITPEQYKQALDLAVQRSNGLYEVLKAEGMATEVQMRALYKSLVPRIGERVAAMTGRFRWVATDAFSSIVPTASTSLLDCLLTSVSRAQEKELEQHLAPRRPLRLAPGEAWAEVTAHLQQACGSDSLTRAINGRATIAQLLEVSPTPQERLARARQVFLLMSTMAVRASLEPIPMQGRPAAAPTAPVDVAPVQPGPAPVSPSAPPPYAAAASTSSPQRPSAKPVVDAAADAGVQFTAEELGARERIAAMSKQIENKDLWEILGIQRGADVNTIKKAFYALSRDFHPDSFAGMRLGTAKGTLDHVFSRIQEAYTTLSDDHRRGEYEAKLKFEAGGGSSDVAAIFQAEGDFNRVKMLVERGELAGATKFIDKVATVLAGNEEVRGYKTFLDWWPTKSPATAEQIVRDLNTWYKAHPSAHSLVEFQGWIHLETGDHKRSKAAFKRVLDVDARHSGANRGMRAVNAKIDESEKANSGLRGLLKR